MKPVRTVAPQRVREQIPTQRRPTPDLARPAADILDLQRKVGNRAVRLLLAAGFPAPAERVLRSEGQPFASDIRLDLEKRFRKDFQDVRVHTGAGATTAADSVNAHAFAVGRHIVFGRGEYVPLTGSGRRLLAHELAHVIQQERGGPAPQGEKACGLERFAAKAAASVTVDSSPVAVQGASAPGILRQEKIKEREHPPITIDWNRWHIKVADVPLFEMWATPEAGNQKPRLSLTSEWAPDGKLLLSLVRNTAISVRLIPDALIALRQKGYDVVASDYIVPTPGELGWVPAGPLPPSGSRRKPPRPRQSKAKKKSAVTPAPRKSAQAEQVEAKTKPEPTPLSTPLPAPAPTEIVSEGTAPAMTTVSEPTPSPAALIEQHTSYWNLHEEALGTALLEYAIRGQAAYVQQVFDNLDTTDRDDVAVAFAEAASDDNLLDLARTELGRRLLDRLFDELTAGEVFSDEQKQADRIRDIKARALFTEEQYAQGMLQAAENIVLPYRKPGFTVFNSSPIYARRLTGGKVWVKVSALLGSKYTEDPDIKLPRFIQSSGIELDETDIVGVKFYDEGGVIGYAPAMYLLQLENESTRTAWHKMAEAGAIGLTLGSGALVGAGGEGAAAVAEVSTLARAGAAIRTGLVWADRLALAVGIVSTVIQEHRGWIIATWKDDGRSFVNAVDHINAYVQVYGLIRGGVGLVQLAIRLRGAYQKWRAAARMIERELNTNERARVDQVANETEALLRELESAKRASAAASERPALRSITGGGQQTPRRTGHLRLAPPEREPLLRKPEPVAQISGVEEEAIQAEQQLLRKAAGAPSAEGIPVMERQGPVPSASKGPVEFGGTKPPAKPVSRPSRDVARLEFERGRRHRDISEIAKGPSTLSEHIEELGEVQGSKEIVTSRGKQRQLSEEAFIREAGKAVEPATVRAWAETLPGTTRVYPNEAMPQELKSLFPKTRGAARSGPDAVAIDETLSEITIFDSTTRLRRTHVLKTYRDANTIKRGLPGTRYKGYKVYSQEGWTDGGLRFSPRKPH